MKWKLLITIGVLIAIVGIPLFYFLPQTLSPKTPDSFIVDSVLLKTVINFNSSFNNQIKVANMQDVSDNFKLEINGLEDFVSSDKTSFNLEPKEIKTVNLLFSNSKNKPSGIYVGAFKISDSKNEKLIPIILEMESQDVLFDSNINLYPSADASNSKVNVEINIFDLGNIGTANIEAEYFIKSFTGEVILYEKENIVVKNNVLISKSFTLPENIKQGEYAFGAVLQYKNSVGTSTYLFRLADSNSSKQFHLSTNTILIIGFLVVIFVLVFFLFYSLYSRDKILMELKDQYKSESERQEVLLKRKESENDQKLKTFEEKLLNKRLFRKVREERKKQLKIIHKERERKIKSLRRHKNGNEISNQISKWKREGYDISILEKTKIPNVDYIKKQLKKWKKKGYETNVLEKSYKGKV